MFTLTGFCPFPSCSDPVKIPVSTAALTTTIYDRSAELPRRAWADFVPEDRVFLQLPYLSVLETDGPRAVENHFVVFRQGSRIVGVALAQQFIWRTDDSLLRGKKVEGFRDQVMSKIARRAHFNLLLLGNLLLTGERAFYFDDSVAEERQLPLLQEALETLNDRYRKQGRTIHGYFYKDFRASRQTEQLEYLRKRRFLELTFAPNMCMQLRPEWLRMDDYLAALTSKYRKRYRRARRKASELTRRTLSSEEIEFHQARIFELYQKIVARVRFNMVELTPGYFAALARAFPRHFALNAYFDGEEMVGFTSSLINGPELEAHFVGLDETYNATHQLYLNMLFDFVERAVEVPEIRTIHFARTAYTIKSSLGAQPETFYSYLRFKSTLAQLTLEPVYRFMEPAPEVWEPRRPFGEEGA